MRNPESELESADFDFVDLDPVVKNRAGAQVLNFHGQVGLRFGGRDPDGNASQKFFHHIGGLQKHLAAAMPMFAPNVNSFRRLTRFHSAPINLEWGYDNRTTGLRIPVSSVQSRRVENRLAGADANPYLAIASSLACGYLGMKNGVDPREPATGNAYEKPFELPRTLDGALDRMQADEELVELLGEKFVNAYTSVKEGEVSTFLQVISSWEREFLLLNV